MPWGRIKKTTAASHYEMRQPEIQSRFDQGFGGGAAGACSFGGALGCSFGCSFGVSFGASFGCSFGSTLGLPSFDRNEFNIENESGIRADGRAGSAALTVCEIRRDIELPLGADGHELNRFRPTLDYPRQRESSVVRRAYRNYRIRYCPQGCRDSGRVQCLPPLAWDQCLP